MNALEIPQGATELTLNELKLICGGYDEAPEAEGLRRKFRLEKVIVIKVFKRRHKKYCDPDPDSDDSQG